MELHNLLLKGNPFGVKNKEEICRRHCLSIAINTKNISRILHRSFLLIILSLTFHLSPFTCVQAQDSNKVSIKPYGFIRNYLTFDSRKTYTVVGGEYNMIPYDQRWNEDHSEDLNDVASMQLQALTSRFGVNITGPKLWGWNTSGKLEGDFGGFGTNNTVLRLRLAYVKIVNPCGNELIVGQDWHPLSGSIMPEVLGMAAGAPFRPHSRTPLVRFNRWFRGDIGYSVALLWQLQYMNNGPKAPNDPTSTNSIEFANNALLPEFFFSFNLADMNDMKYLYFQLGIDIQMLRPRTHALIDGVTQKVNETVLSFTPTLYMQHEWGDWSVKFRTLLAENTSHLNQLCGYAFTGISDDGSWSYAPIRNSISYLNIAYGKKVCCNLFLGYMKNLGASSTLALDPATGGYHIYMKGGENFTHLNSVYRIAPSISYNIKAFNLGLEYEWTACTYGDLDKDGSVKQDDNLHQVANHRICALVKYNF